MLFDTTVFVGLGNHYYCHKHTLYRTVAVYNLTVDRDNRQTSKQLKMIFQSRKNVGLLGTNDSHWLDHNQIVLPAHIKVFANLADG